MKFAAVIEYISDQEKVQSLRPVHRQYLAGLKERGRLAAAGPFADGSGALIVYEAADAAEAEGLLRDDPFHRHGVFVRYTLRPWTPALANRELFPAT
jgi:uncharacterized protein YciI